MTTEFKTNDFMTEIDNNAYNSNSVEKKVDFAVSSYMKLLDSNLTGEAHNNYKTILLKDFLNYIKSNNIDVNKSDTAECIAKTAFSRLKSASENYCISKLSSPEDYNLTNLKQHAQQMKKEYELVKSFG